MVRYLGGGLSDDSSIQKKRICSKNNVLLWSASDLISAGSVM